MPPSQKGSRKKKAAVASMSTSKSNITEKKKGGGQKLKEKIEGLLKVKNAVEEISKDDLDKKMIVWKRQST